MTDVKSYKEKYHHAEKLASGGQGTTLIGYESDKENAEGVLLKLLNRQQDPERRARMHREYTILQTLEHEAIPKVFDSNTDHYLDTNYKLYIAMEFVEGPTLNEYVIEHGPFSVNEAVGLSLQLLDAIDFCHKNGIVHRDIKPSNIILRSGNKLTPVLVDFGLSFNKEDETNLTSDGHIIGNRFLFLPELGKNSDDKSDIRSDITMVVGLLFFVLTGNEPGHLADQNDAMPHQRAQLIKGKETLSEVNHIFDTGFQPNISHRFQDITTLRVALELVLEPKVKPEKIGQRLSAYLEKSLNASNIEKLANERMMREIESQLNALFFQVQSELKGAVSLGRIKRHSGETSCWCAYSIQEKLSSRKRICVRLEANLLGNQVMIAGGVVELHGLYTGTKHQIFRASKADFKQIEYNKIYGFLLDQVLGHFESEND